MGLRKKGFYFTLDAFFAAMLLITGLILLSKFSFQEISTEQINLLSKDILTSFSELEVGRINNSWIQQEISSGSIADVDNSVLAQIGEYWATGNLEKAKNLSELLAQNLIPKKYGFSILADGEIIYVRNISKAQDIVSAQRMISGIAQGVPIEGSSSSAYLRKIRSKKTSSYAYFGGFVGQGIISVVLENLPLDINSSNIKEILVEGSFGSNFTILINDQLCQGMFYPQASSLEVDVWNLSNCSSLLTAGDNIINVSFQNSSFSETFISGGYFKVTYLTEEIQGVYDIPGYKKYLLPGISGVVNLFDGFNVPGELTNMNIRLHYYVDPVVTKPLFLDIGNVTVYEANVTGVVDYTIINITLSSLLNYSFLSDRTVPFKLGFYEGNSSTTVGNITDAFLLTSRAGTMEAQDIEGTNLSRLEAAKNTSHVFIDIALSAKGNRLGLGSYFASSHIDYELSTNASLLHEVIDGYVVQNPESATRDMCHNIIDAKGYLAGSGSGRGKSIVFMTDGNSTKCCSSGKCTPEKARNDVISAACDDYNISKVRFYTIGFGATADNDLLENIANCTEGLFRASTNFTGLQDIYEEFANSIAQSSIVYEFQRAISAENVHSILYPDSYIELNFTSASPPVNQGDITVVFQSEMFSNCNYQLSIPVGLRVRDSVMTSYSAEYWTRLIQVDETTVYNLSDFGNNFSRMGDPYRIMIPSNLLTSGNHDFRVIIAGNESSDEGCSNNNSLIYTGLVNFSTIRSSVVEVAVGCNWIIEFEDGAFINETIPTTYSGSENCSYTNSSINYKNNDAYDLVVFNLLKSIDFDDDGRILFNIDAEDLEIVADTVSGIPYMWGPTIIEARVWQ